MALYNRCKCSVLYFVELNFVSSKLLSYHKSSWIIFENFVLGHSFLYRFSIKSLLDGPKIIMKRLTECHKLYRELPIFQVSISSSGGPNVHPPRCPGAVPEPEGAGGVWPDSPGAAPRHHPPVRPRPLHCTEFNDDFEILG